MVWPCFMIEPSRRYYEYLRRYADGPCSSGGSYHNAVVIIDVVERADGDPEPVTSCDGAVTAEMEATPGWPIRCGCGYVFTSSDQRQFGYDQLYEAADGRRFTLRGAPPGAMWHASWMAHVQGHNRANDPRGPLVVRCPGGSEWNIDGPSTNGDGWTRTGTPPLVTANPSIVVPGYHGWLKDGVLSGDLEGRNP